MKGGKREGAGRPKGQKNKATQEYFAGLIASGITPLEYMLEVMRDPTVDHSRRQAMATASAPYVHPRLASTEISGNADKPIEHKLKIEFVRAGE